MKRSLFGLVLGVALFAACGGGGGDDSPSDADAASNPEGTAGLAAAFQTELVKVQECTQAELDGKGACAIDLFSSPVSRMCSDVRTGRASAFAGADYTKFEATCTAWADVLSTPKEARVAKITTMVDALKALSGT